MLRYATGVDIIWRAHPRVTLLPCDHAALKMVIDTRVLWLLVGTVMLWVATLLAGGFWLRPEPAVLPHALSAGKDNCELYQLRAEETADNVAVTITWWRGLSEPVNSFTSLVFVLPAIYAARKRMLRSYEMLFGLMSVASFGNHATHAMAFHLLDYTCIVLTHAVVCADIYRQQHRWCILRRCVVGILTAYVSTVMNYERVVRDTVYDIDLYSNGRLHGPFVMLCVSMYHTLTRAHNVRVTNLLGDMMVGTVAVCLLPYAGYGFQEQPLLNLPVIIVHVVMMHVVQQDPATDDAPVAPQTMYVYASAALFWLGCACQSRVLCERYQYVHAVYHVFCALGYVVMLAHVRHARGCIDTKYARLRSDAVSLELELDDR